MEEFWTTFAINHISHPANPNDDIFKKESKEKLNKILEKVKGAKLMKVNKGALGLNGNKYFVWKDWGPIAWWDFDEKDNKVESMNNIYKKFIIYKTCILYIFSLILFVSTIEP